MPNYFIVAGIEPIHSPLWHAATPAQRGAYLRACRELVLIEWDKQFGDGLDKDGFPLTRITKKTREYRKSAMGWPDKNAPPLQPAHALSRTRSLIDAKIVGLTIKVFWKFDPHTGKRWGTILGYHSEGKGHLPVRDVFGISQESRQRMLQAAFTWWDKYSRGEPVVFPMRPRARQRGGKPEPAPKAQRPRVAGPGAPKMLPSTSDIPDARGANLVFNGNIYTTSVAGAKDLISLIRSGEFSGFHGD